MLIARYQQDGTEACGVVDVEAGVVRELAGATFEAWLTDETARRSEHSVEHPLDRVELLPPMGRNAKIFCVGFNYLTHSTEMDRAVPEQPTLFIRHPDSVTGPDRPIWRPAESHELDWEGEVAIVVGATARRVPATNAHAYIAGYTAFADNSIRDWQFASTQATAGKNWLNSGSCGPWMRTLDGVTLNDLQLDVRLNDQQVQSDSTANLHYDCAALLAYVSTFTVLRPGDVIATGTPSGIGYRQEPPRFLRPGDRLEVTVSGLNGTLSNHVQDEPIAAMVGNA